MLYPRHLAQDFMNPSVQTQTWPLPSESSQVLGGQRYADRPHCAMVHWVRSGILGWRITVAALSRSGMSATWVQLPTLTFIIATRPLLECTINLKTKTLSLIFKRKTF